MEDKQRATLLTAGLTLALYFSGIFVFLTPLPFVFLALKRGRESLYGPALASLTLVCALYVFGLDFFFSLYNRYPALVWLLPIPSLGLSSYFSRHIVMVLGIGYYAFYMIVGYAVSAILTAPSRLYARIAVSVGGIFLGTVLYNAVLLFPEAGRLLSDYRTYMAQGIEQIIKLQDQTAADGIELIYLRSHVGEIIRYTTCLLPSFIMVMVTCLFMLNLVLAKRLFMVFFPALADISFIRFRAPFMLVWSVIVLLAVFLINAKFLGNGFVHFTALNLLLTAALVYFFQGCAILIHVMDGKKIFGFFRMGIYFTAVLFAQATAILLTAAGFFDNWLDLRKLDAPVTPPKPPLAP